MAIKYIFRAIVLKVEERFNKAHVSGSGPDALFNDISIGWWVTLSGSRNAQFFGMAPIDLKVGDAVETTVMKRPSEESASQIVIEPKPPAAPPATRAPERVEMRVAEFAMAIAAEQPKELRFAEARAKGYEGDPCNDCGNFTLVRSGTCMKCDSCGSTTGCS